MVTTIQTYHVPVLLKESVDGLDIQADGVYVDVTFGGGGHSREILNRLGDDGHLYSFDQDADAERNIGEAFADDTRFTFVRSNFRYLMNWMRYYGVEHIDGLLADLGVSSHHLDDEQRGFSFRFDAPLDMRMNKRNARRVAKAIVKRRAENAIVSTHQLMEVLSPEISREREKKELAKAFQALRIEVNHEMDALSEMLQAAIRLLRPGGRLSVITYHSVEDRIVKNMLRAGNMEGKVEQDFFGRSTSPMSPLSNKVIVPSDEEQANNPRSRSAKLRIGIKQ